MAIKDFLSSRIKRWSKDAWDGLILAIEARFQPLEEQLDVQKQTTSAIVQRGLQVIEDELAPVIADGGTVLAGINAIKAEAEIAAAAIQALLDQGITIAAIPELQAALDALDAHAADAGNPHNVTPAQIGTLTSAEIAAAIQTAKDDLVGAAPGTLDTLAEIATALGNDEDLAATLTAAIATKLSLAGGTLTGDLDMGGNALSDVVLSTYDEAFNDLGAGSGTRTLDLSAHRHFGLEVSTAQNDIALSNVPASGSVISISILITNGGSQTVTWPWTWPDGAPTLQAVGVDEISARTNDGGTTWMPVHTFTRDDS